MNGYKAFYRDKTFDLYADTAYQAHQIAVKHFKAKKAHLVSVHLCSLAARPGEQVMHTPT